MRISAAALKRIKDFVEAERAIGDPQVATDIEMLLMAYLKLVGKSNG